MGNDFLQHHELACSTSHDVDSWQLGIIHDRYVGLQGTGLFCHVLPLIFRSLATLHELVDGRHSFCLRRRDILRFDHDRLELLYHRWDQSCRLASRMEHG